MGRYQSAVRGTYPTLKTFETRGKLKLTKVMNQNEPKLIPDQPLFWLLERGKYKPFLRKIIDYFILYCSVIQNIMQKITKNCKTNEAIQK